jgi:RHS repeat-associated protein
VDGTTANVSDYYCANVNGGGSPYTCPANGAFVEVTQYLGAPVNGTSVQNAPTTLVFYDALGRVIAQDVQAFDGNWNQVDTEYDSNGYVVVKSRPYETSLSTAQCPQGAVCTTLENDILGRVQMASYPNDKGGTSATGYQYEGLTTVVTNDLGQSTTTTRNVQGLVANVTDANNQTTSYSWDAFGDLLSVGTPKHANQLVNTYDVRGRKATSTDLDMGYWQYGYDSLGELITQISPVENNNGQSTTLGYDRLDRLESRTEPDMSANWYYDQAANGVGLPYQATCQGSACAGAAGGQTYVRTYHYDGFSRPSKLTTDYPALGTFTASESYDGTNGGTGTERLTTVTTFSGFQYTNGYNGVGYLDQITDANSNAVYWTANAMDASGNLTQETAGNGVSTYRTFWSESGRVEQIEAESSGAPPGGQPATIANLSYDWDTIGNLTSRNDTVNGVAENFCYLDNADGTANVLNRLSNYSVGSADASCTDGSLVKSIAYDNDGNIAQKSDIGGYSYGQGSAGPHALTSIATDAGVLVDGVANPNLVYDPDGNMVCVNAGSGCAGAARSYSWTSFDMAETVTQGASSATLAYDPEHNRGSQTDAGTGNVTWYFRNPAAGSASELLAGTTSTWRDYLVAYREIVAERFDTGGTPTVYYFVADHLASTAALTDANETQKEYDSYDAWGKRRNANGTDQPNCLSMHPQSFTLRGFTAQEEMDNFCLVNLNARLYDPALGRMLSADPTVPYPMSGQSFNRYSYVENNPLALVDPSGYAAGCPDDPTACAKIVCIECMDGNMPCWGCSGQGVWGVNSNGVVIGAEFAGWAFTNPQAFGAELAAFGVSSSLLASAGVIEIGGSGGGGSLGAGLGGAYAWLNGSGNSCSPGSGTACEGVPNGWGATSIGTATGVTITGPSQSLIIPGWGGPSFEQLGNSLQSMLNSPAGMQAVNDLIGFSKNAEQIGQIASRAGATGAIAGVATADPALFTAGVVLGGSGVVVTQIGSAAGLLGGGLQSVQQGSWAPFATSLIDFIEPDLNFSPLW